MANPKSQETLIEISDFKGMYANSISSINAPINYCEYMENFTVYKQTLQNRPNVQLFRIVPPIEAGTPVDVLLIVENPNNVTKDRDFMLFTQIEVYRVLAGQMTKVITKGLDGEETGNVNFGTGTNKPTSVYNSLNKTVIILGAYGDLYEINSLFTEVSKVKYTAKLLNETATIEVFGAMCGCEIDGGFALSNLTLTDYVQKPTYIMWQTRSPVTGAIEGTYNDCAIYGAFTSLCPVQGGIMSTTSSELRYFEKTTLKGTTGSTTTDKTFYENIQFGNDICPQFVYSLPQVGSDAVIYTGDDIKFVNASSFGSDDSSLPDFTDLTDREIETEAPIPIRNIIGRFLPLKKTVIFSRVSKIEPIHRMMSIDYGTSAYGYHYLYEQYGWGGDSTKKMRINCFTTYKKGIIGQPYAIFGGAPVTIEGDRTYYGLFVEEDVSAKEIMPFIWKSVRMNPFRSKGFPSCSLNRIHINIEVTGYIKDTFKIIVSGYNIIDKVIGTQTYLIDDSLLTGQSQAIWIGHESIRFPTSGELQIEIQLYAETCNINKMMLVMSGETQII